MQYFWSYKLLCVVVKEELLMRGKVISRTSLARDVTVRKTETSSTLDLLVGLPLPDLLIFFTHCFQVCKMVQCERRQDQIGSTATLVRTKELSFAN